MNKKHFLVLTLVFFVSLLFLTASTNNNSGSFKYVGVSKCQTCHKGDAKGKQLEIWQDSKHAQAYKTLETPEADKIAKDKGFSTPAKETPQCLKCHVLGKDIDPAELDDSFDKTQGVQCESCHGPGSEYKSMSIMKDKQQAIDKGLNVPADKEAFCKTCHNADSPTNKEFKFDDFWAKIKHPKP
jgi:hypothetical protein